MPAQPIGELPTETLPTVELPNPVILPDMDFSKNNFNAQMEAAKTAPTETETPTETPTVEATPKPEAQPTPEPAPEKGTTDDKVEIPTEVSPASRANLPEELLTGKKPEPQIDDAIQKIRDAKLPDNAKADAIKNFGELKKYAESIVQEKLARINELESKTSEGASRHEIEAASERVKAAEAKAKELESTIERIAFTESPKFKRFLNDESATLTSAKAYFEGTEINPEIVEYAARVGGAQRVKILREAGLDAELIASVQPYLAEFDKIQRYKQGALENWKVEAAQQSEAYKAQQTAQADQRRKAEDEVWSQVQTDLSNLVPYRKFEKNESWNTRADELLSKAKTVYNGDGVDLKEVGTIIGKGMAYDALDEVRIALTDELNKVRGENTKLKSAKPGASNGQVTVANGSDANLTEEQRRKRDFNVAMGAARGGA